MPCSLVQKDGLGQSDVPLRYLDQEKRRGDAPGRRVMQQNVTWAPHGIMTSSLGQDQEEERSGQNRHQGEEMLAGGGLRDAVTFLLPDPVLLPGGRGAPMLSLGSPGILSCPGRREDRPSESILRWTSVGTGAWSPSGLPRLTGGAGV